MSKWLLAPLSNFEVVGYDSEWADISNPKGAIICEVIYLTAANEIGERWCYRLGRIPMDKIEREVSRMMDLICHYGVDPKHDWTPMDPVYGSEAYELGGYEARNLYLERDAEAMAF